MPTEVTVKCAQKEQEVTFKLMNPEDERLAQIATHAANIDRVVNDLVLFHRSFLERDRDTWEALKADSDTLRRFVNRTAEALKIPNDGKVDTVSIVALGVGKLKELDRLKEQNHKLFDERDQQFKQLLLWKHLLLQLMPIVSQYHRDAIGTGRQKRATTLLNKVRAANGIGPIK